MEWIDDIRLLENMTTHTNESAKDKELDVPIFKPNKIEWDNFDTYLNKISKFSYLVGICKILPYNVGHNDDDVTKNNNTATATATYSNKKKYNREHYVIESTSINTNNNEVYLLNTHYYNENDFKKIKHKSDFKYLNKNAFNEDTIWDNLLNYSVCYTLFSVNLKHNNNASSRDNDDIQVDEEKHLYDFILNNRNISLLQDNTSINFVESSIGLIKNWEILESNTFKIYYLHANNKTNRGEHSSNNKSIRDNKNSIRIWYSIIEDDICKFYKTLKEALNLKLKISSTQKSLYQKNFIKNNDDFIIHPKWLIDHDIKFTKTIQYSNEMIAVFPSSCTFALDLTNGNKISEIQFNFEINYNRPTILEKCLCSDNNSNNNNNNNKDNTANIINCTTVPTMVALDSSTNIPRTTLEHSLSTNEFNESISRISSPLFSRLLNTGNTTTTTLSSGGTNYDDTLNINEKENHGDTFLLPSIESVVNINDRLHYDSQTNLDINYGKNKAGPHPTNPLSSDVVTDELHQKHTFKDKFVPGSNFIVNVNSSSQMTKPMISPSHMSLPPLITPQLESYKLITTNPATLTSSINHMLTNNNSTTSNNNVISSTGDTTTNNNIGNTINYNHTGYFPNPEQICLNTSTTRNDMVRRIASPSFLPINISRGITESPLSLSMTVPLSNENFGRYNINAGYGTINKPSKLMNSSLMASNEPNYFTHNGSITNPYSLLENGSFHNDSMDLMGNDPKINIGLNKRKSLGNGVSKKKEKRYTTLAYNNLLYNRFQEQEKFNQDSTVSNISSSKGEHHFNIEQRRQDINNSQSSFTPHQSQTRFLPSEVLITDSGKVYVCCDCKRQFSSGHHLTRHKKSVHSGEKPHSCPKCGKKFKRRDHVLQHLNKKIPCK